MNDIPMFYRKSGSGKPVVFLHGFCETHNLWDSISAIVQNDHQVYIPDLPGFGQSPLIRNEFSLEDIARLLDDWIRQIGIGPFTLIGHSLGGYISLAYAKLFGSKLTGLGLFHSSVFEDNEEKKENRTRLIRLIEEAGVKPFISTFIPSLFYGPRQEELKDLIEKQKIVANQTSPQTIKSYAAAMRDRKSSVEVVREFEKPVMFIIGENDLSVPIEKSLEQAILPRNVHILRLKETAHMGMFESPDETSRFIHKFLYYCE